VRATADKGLNIHHLSALLRVDTLQLEPVLESLAELDWIGLLHEEMEGTAARFVLLANPDTTPLAPLLNALLLRQENTTLNLWQNGRWTSMKLREAL
jgi:membrane protein